MAFRAPVIDLDSVSNHGMVNLKVRARDGCALPVANLRSTAASGPVRAFRTIRMGRSDSLSSDHGDRSLPSGTLAL
jgi:hypothetical protein